MNFIKVFVFYTLAYFTLAVDLQQRFAAPTPGQLSVLDCISTNTMMIPVADEKTCYFSQDKVDSFKIKLTTWTLDTTVWTVPTVSCSKLKRTKKCQGYFFGGYKTEDVYEAEIPTVTECTKYFAEIPPPKDNTYPCVYCSYNTEEVDEITAYYDGVTVDHHDLSFYDRHTGQYANYSDEHVVGNGMVSIWALRDDIVKGQCNHIQGDITEFEVYVKKKDGSIIIKSDLLKTVYRFSADSGHVMTCNGAALVQSDEGMYLSGFPKDMFDKIAHPSSKIRAEDPTLHGLDFTVLESNGNLEALEVEIKNVECEIFNQVSRRLQRHPEDSLSMYEFEKMFSIKGMPLNVTHGIITFKPCTPIFVSVSGSALDRENILVLHNGQPKYLNPMTGLITEDEGRRTDKEIPKRRAYTNDGWIDLSTMTKVPNTEIEGWNMKPMSYHLGAEFVRRDGFPIMPNATFHRSKEHGKIFGKFELPTIDIGIKMFLIHGAILLVSVLFLYGFGKIIIKWWLKKRSNKKVKTSSTSILKTAKEPKKKWFKKNKEVKFSPVTDQPEETIEMETMNSDRDSIYDD